MLPSRKNLAVIVSGLLLVLVLLGSLSGMTVFAQADVTHLQSDTLFSDIYDQVSPSVVAINVVARRPNTGFPGPDQTIVGSGSGFVIDTDGHILTNNHVVEGATDIEVSFFDGTLARAEIIGLEPSSDLAVLKVDLPAEDLHPVAFGNSDALDIGQTVLAIGSPFGQRWTLTSGIVSALERTIQGLTEFSIGGVIQTDAAINPGNSGGPLLNLSGEVIGVNSQIISESRSNAGIGFAVPGNLAQRVATDLIDRGYIEYSYLGIRGGNVNLSIVEAFNLSNHQQGVVVEEAMAGGPAARAGILSAVYPETARADTASGATVPSVPTSVDIITAINGEALTGISDLITYLAAHTRPGDSATLTVLRNGTDELQLSVKLTPRPGS